ncbi:hypothetical protein [Enterococcus sp. LJL120]
MSEDIMIQEGIFFGMKLKKRQDSSEILQRIELEAQKPSASSDKYYEFFNQYIAACSVLCLRASNLLYQAIDSDNSSELIFSFLIGAKKGAR